MWPGAGQYRHAVFQCRRRRKVAIRFMGAFRLDVLGERVRGCAAWLGGEKTGDAAFVIISSISAQADNASSYGPIRRR
jgi:hypothetical protein